MYAVFAVEWVQTGLVAQNSLSLYVYHFGDVDNLNSFGNAWFSVPVITGVVSIAVQLFYARRIWALGRSKVLVAVICVVTFQAPYRRGPCLFRHVCIARSHSKRRRDRKRYNGECVQTVSGQALIFRLWSSDRSRICVGGI